MLINDKTELYRLTDLLKSISVQFVAESPYQEVLKKAALALQHVFVHGHRAEFERMYALMGKSLSAEDIEQLKTMGIEPDNSRT